MAATTGSSPRSTPSSTGSGGSSCRGPTSRRSALKDRVRLRLEDDHVGVWPDRPTEPPSGREADRPRRGAVMTLGGERSTYAPTRRPVAHGPCRRSRRSRHRDFASGDGVVHALARGRPGGRAAASCWPSAAARAAARRRSSTSSGGLDRPTAGRVLVDGHEVSAMSRGRARRAPASHGRATSSRRSGSSPILSRRGERRDPAPAASRRSRATATSGSASCSSWSASASGRGIGRTSCRAASSSGSPSPGRSPTGRSSSSPTSRPASSTPRPATRS